MITPVLPTYNRAPIAFVKGEGSWLTAEDGSRYLDLGAGIAVNALGHAHPALVAALTSAGVGVFHVGVEQGWWEGLLQCSVNTLAGVSAGDLLNTDVNVGAPAACDKVAWSLLGISMPGWNVISSTAVAGLWALVARKA